MSIEKMEFVNIAGLTKDLDAVLEKLSECGEFLRRFSGFNITIPHKVNVIKLIDELAESAKRYVHSICLSVSC